MFCSMGSHTPRDVFLFYCPMLRVSDTAMSSDPARIDRARRPARARDPRNSALCHVTRRPDLGRWNDNDPPRPVESVTESSLREARAVHAPDAMHDRRHGREGLTVPEIPAAP